MSRQSWVEVLCNAEGDITLANSASETSLTPKNAGIAVPAYYMEPGRIIRVKASGILSTTGTPTFQFKLKWGSTSIAQTTAFTTVSGASNLFWELEAWMTSRVQGVTNTGGTLIGGGRINAQSPLVTSTPVLNITPVSNAAVTGLDLVGAGTIDLTGTWGTASSSNTITVQQLAVESLN